MNPTRQTKIDDLEAVMQLKIRQGDLPMEALVQEKLTHLRAFIRQLALTPNGKIDLARRVQLFGECLPSPGESDRQYYGKLRHWLDRDLQSQTVT